MQLNSFIACLLAFSPAALASLPRTFKLPVKFTNGTDAGCINNRGNFITYMTFCAIYNSFPVDGTDARQVKNQYYCKADGGTLDCNEQDAGKASLFNLMDNDLAVDGGGKEFSVDSIPTDNKDTVGVPTIVGSGGSIQLILHVQQVGGKAAQK